MPKLNAVTQLKTTTLSNYKNEIIDSVQNFHPLLVKLKEKGNIIRESGGTSFQHKISYAANSTVQWQDSYDTYDTTPQDVIDSADFAQKIISGTVEMNSLELRQNAGKEQLVNLMDVKMKNLIISIKNNIGAAFYADGTGSDSKEMGGLQLLIADDPTTGTVGGIDRALFTFWRNKLYDFSVESVTPSKDTIQEAMNTLFMRCQSQMGQQTDLIVADSTYFSFYEQSLQTIQRITDNSSMGKLGFTGLKYKNSDVFYDPECPANHMYFLNTNYLHLQHLGEFLEQEETTRPVNQGVYVTPVTGLMNMTISNARVHGVMIA
jgi:hypothetical protein